MKLTYIAILAGCSLTLAACAPIAPDASGESASDSADALSKRPIPFVRQMAGTYYADDSDADVQMVEVRPTGRYRVTFWDGSTESGSYRGPSKVPSPLGNTAKLVFLTTGFKFTGVVADGYGTSPTTLTITRDGGDTHLTLDRPATADESLCDDTGGAWSDDEADPTTGLFCDCPSTAPSFIPSEGGCTH